MFLVVILLGCSEEKTVDSNPDFNSLLSYDVHQLGPFSIGYTMVNQSVSLPSGIVKSIPMNMWYPTEDLTGDSAFYLGFQEDAAVHLDAEPLFREMPSPVMTYSHGRYLYGGSASYLMRHFASHGWVVVAPDHIDNTTENYGDVVGLDMYVQRTHSIYASIDAVESEFGTHVDTAEVLVSGFSLGAFDNWMAAGAQLDIEAVQSHCEEGGLGGVCTPIDLTAIAEGFEDTRVAGIVPMGGSKDLHWFKEDGLNQLGEPILLISASEDDDSPQAYFDAAKENDLRWMEITGGCHALFSAGGCADIARETGWQMVSAYSLAFGRLVLLEDQSVETANMLSGADSNWSEISIRLP